MDCRDGCREDLLFKEEIVGEGATKLKIKVKEKLMEYMGDYIDDALVEYVIVLLNNGRGKEDARKELHVFLGDDSMTFINWLWDHVSSNFCHYAQPKGSSVATSNTVERESIKTNGSKEEFHREVQMDSAHETEMSKKSTVRECKGSLQEGNETFPLRTLVTNILHGEEKKERTTSAKPLSPVHLSRKRGRDDDEQNLFKRNPLSYPSVNAPRRLLQFAVRDAVRTVQHTSSAVQPAVKRFCSAVPKPSTDTEQSKRQERRRHAFGASGAALAIKAAAEAAQDVVKVRSSGSVFDRLSRGAGDPLNQQVVKNEKMPFDDPMSDEDDFEQSSDDSEKEPDMRTDENDRYFCSSFSQQQVKDPSFTDPSPIQENSIRTKQIVANDTVVGRKIKTNDVDAGSHSAPVAHHKTVNVSVNMDIWKTSNHQQTRCVAAVANLSAESNMRSMFPKTGLSNENILSTLDDAKGPGTETSQNELPKASTSAANAAVDDVDSRTLYVSNVHFAATKDALSRHFNKYGAVLKVVLITDGATGQPTGSAYIEFLQKESAELALSLNGTSFMSRILRVVRHSTREASQFLGWSGNLQSSSFACRLMSRMVYPRGMLPGAFRSRLPIKTGARSLQWKRGPPTIQSPVPVAAKSDTDVMPSSVAAKPSSMTATN